MTDSPQKTIIERYQRAKDRRGNWETHWQECFDYALPHREPGTQLAQPGGKRTDKLFDGTAPDGVEQLAASLLSQLTPPWARWFGLMVGSNVDDTDRQEISTALEKASAVLQSHFDRSNFTVEMHQCYMDLVTAGTACLLFEEAPPGEASAFRFTAVPLTQVVFEESAAGRLDTTFRRSELSVAQYKERLPKAALPDDTARGTETVPDYRIAIIEAVFPNKNGFRYVAVTEEAGDGQGAGQVVTEGRFPQSPFINFRWLKAPGEIYGRSPEMKALPNIKTANKVVELTLKNASITVTGIWQADDDGVLNPASIRLAPGTIIPKADGSAGPTPLDSPGRFDISELMLKDLRAAIRRALLVDRLGQPESPRMTATEVVERSAEMARLLGATYGRLQSEFLTPLVSRAISILNRRGVTPAIAVDGHTVELQYKSPLARQQAQRDTQNAMAWLDMIGRLGPMALAVIDQDRLVRWLAQAYGVPEDLMQDPAAAGPLELSMDEAALGDLSAAAEGVISALASAAGPAGVETTDLDAAPAEVTHGRARARLGLVRPWGNAVGRPDGTPRGAGCPLLPRRRRRGVPGLPARLNYRPSPRSGQQQPHAPPLGGAAPACCPYRQPGLPRPYRHPDPPPITRNGADHD